MKLNEDEKKFDSVFMYEPTFKVDFKKFKEEKQIKYKIDILSTLLIVLSVIVFFLDLLQIPFLWILGILLLVFGLLRLRKSIRLYNIEILKKYEAYIANNKPGNNAVALSAIYPVYLITSNEDKTLKITYQDKDYIYCDYEDIKGFNIYIDRFKTGNRLPDKPDPTIRSYIIEILFNNNHAAEVGFSNACNKIHMKKKYAFQQFANTKSINKIASTIDRIQKKGRI